MTQPRPTRAELRRRAETAAEALVPEDQRQDRECPICGFAGRFAPMASDKGVRLDACCPSCGALERHRHLALCLVTEPDLARLGRVVHVAPEAAVRRLLELRAEAYVAADLDARKAEIALDIEAMDLPDGSVDTFVLNHVLEHVDDARALAEIRRVLAPGGRAILSVPVVFAWERTYEAEIADPALRRLHFGQRDHLRRYGRDFPDRVTAVGFSVRALAATPEDCARYALAPASVIFIATRRSP